MYRIALAVDAIGRDEPGMLDLGREQMQIALTALTSLNLAILRRMRMPRLYESGIRYDRMTPHPGSTCGDDDWQDMLVTLRRRMGDCEDLACYRAAELQVQGIRARAIPLFMREPGHHYYHIVVEWPRGLVSYPSTVYNQFDMLLEDPSKVLGMRGDGK